MINNCRNLEYSTTLTVLIYPYEKNKKFLDFIKKVLFRVLSGI
ncbi:hypothetical protein AQAU111925_12520 [Aquirufa aurantiipilula]